MVGSNVNKVFTSKVRQLYFISVRHRRSRWLGYYDRKVSPPVYEARKWNYKKTILKPLEEFPTLEQKLKELNAKDPIFDAVIDIGLPGSVYKKTVSFRERLDYQKKLKMNPDLEKEALAKRLKVDLDAIYNDWQDTVGPMHIKNVAEHYDIFLHLFQHASFTPWIPLNIYYDYDEDSVTPVYTGNILESCEALQAPHVQFSSNPDDLWSLILTNLDGHLLDTNAEYLHWFVGNVKGCDIQTGEVICDYLRPFPLRGTGYHRLVFVLYKQEKLLDFSSLKRKSPCLSLKERTFKTFDFYKEHQENLTPAGLAFFQCTWDPSLTDFFHNVLNMHEPIFDYNEKQKHCKPQVQYPHLMPFNIYLDRYRDPKDITKEVILKRLKMIHPFKEEPPMPKHPCLHKPIQNVPSWLKEDFDNERMRRGKYRDLRPHSVYPQEDNQGKYPHKS